MSKQYVFYFGANNADGRAEMKEILGGKGANLYTVTATPKKGVGEAAKYNAIDINGRKNHHSQIRTKQKLCAKSSAIFFPLYPGGIDQQPSFHHQKMLLWKVW